MSKITSLLVRGGAIAAVIGCVVAGAGAGVSGCGNSIDPGEYVIYRVSFGEIPQSGGCFPPDNTLPAEYKYDSSTYRDSETWILFAGTEDVRYLDTGKVTLEGSQADDAFSFAGKSVDVEYANPNGTGPKTTVTVTATIDMTTDGDAVSGSVVTKTVSKCTGSDACPKSTSCTESVDFIGTRVEDVDLEHDADKGGDGAPVIQLPTDPSTTGTGGFGGSGGSGTTGGFGGGTGGTPTCTTCGAVLAGLVTISDLATLCTESQTLAINLLNCACSPCSPTCDNACNGTGPVDSSCSSCGFSACPTEWNACSADVAP